MILDFDCEVDLPPSKSLVIRALLAKSYFPSLRVTQNSRADDVLHTLEIVRRLSTPSDSLRLDAGAAGAVFRFFALRLSRIPGTHELHGSPRLLSRAPEELARLLESLGARVTRHASRWEIAVAKPDWSDAPEIVAVDISFSSQVASGLLLNAWKLPFDLRLQLRGEARSFSYFRMSLALFQTLGGQVEVRSEREYLVPRNQKCLCSAYRPEADLSGAFSLVAAALQICDVRLRNFPEQSLQGDARFTEILERMGIEGHREAGTWLWRRAFALRGLEMDLAETPDLFPSLALLTAFAHSPSRLSGAPHLRTKESDRIAVIEEIFRQIRVAYRSRADGIEVLSAAPPAETFTGPRLMIDPHDDHRIAMAAEILTLRGYPIDLLNRQCVSKSFPNFFELLGEKSA